MDAFRLPEVDAFLRYADLPGRGPALVYLTGLGLAVWGTYDRCLADPALGAHRAVLPDVFGAGFSDAPEAFSYTLEGHARALAALLDRLGLGAGSGGGSEEAVEAGPTIVGYSFGGAVAITLAAIRPDLVASLVLAEPNLDPGGGFFSRAIAEQSEASFRAGGFAKLVAECSAKGRRESVGWAVTSGMIQAASAHGLHRSAVGLVQGTRPTMRERLLGLAVPRAVIRGEASGPDRRRDELVGAGVRMLVVPRAGHGMMWENPGGFVAAVRTALSSTTA